MMHDRKDRTQPVVELGSRDAESPHGRFSRSGRFCRKISLTFPEGTIMLLTFLGTGGAQQVPVFGCQCVACQRARKNPAFRRQPCSAKLDYAGEVTLIDAGLPELAQQFTAGEIQRFWLTHYHMDHVQGLFPLRWESEMRSRSMARRMKPDVTICSNIPVFWISNLRFSRLRRVISVTLN